MGEYQRKRAAQARRARMIDAGTIEKIDPAEAARIAKAALKGRFDGNCNRTDCQEPIKGRNWFNTSTRAYYCTSCSRSINHWSLRDDGQRICVEVSTPDDRPAFKILERVA